MNAIRTSVAVALMALGAVSMAPAAQASAAEHGGHHRGPEQMFEQLGLSADQKARVDAIMAAQGPALKNLHEQMRTNMEKLHSTKPDDPNYGALVSQVAQTNGSLMTQAISAQGDMHARLYAILTPAQRTQLEQMQAKMCEHMKDGAGHWRHHPPPMDEDAPMPPDAPLPPGAPMPPEGSPPM